MLQTDGDSGTLSILLRKQQTRLFLRWKKAWFIVVTLGVDIFYTWCAFRFLMGTIHEVVDRLVEKHESVWGPFRTVEESEGEEDSSQNSKIKDYHDKWSAIRNEDDQLVMSR